MITLYKKDSKGKLRVLKISVEGADLVQESGLADGKLVPARKTCKGKNIGKSNETSPEEQAMNELLSKVAEKTKVDYFNTEEEAMNAIIILPMLAKDYKEHNKKINWKKEVFTQPKLDGMRCLILVRSKLVKLISRENTDILEQHGNSMKHIAEEFSKLPDGVYDGELYAHGYTFQENMELIKKYRPGQSELVKFHAYDMISNEPFSRRIQDVYRILKDCPVVSLVATKVITSLDDLKQCHSKYIGDGYEGTIIRHGDVGYEIDKRTSNLLKYKDFVDIAAIILDVIPMENRPKQAKLVCRERDNKDGEFKASLKFSHAERERILIEKDKYIGKTAEIRFFEYTDEGLPRFPVCVGFRLDK